MTRLALASIALMTSSCGLLDAQLETRTVCYTPTDNVIPGADGSGSVETDLSLDPGSALPVLSQPGASYRLSLQDLELSPGKGSSVTDLGGVDELDVSVIRPAGTSLPELELIHYLRGTDPHPPRIVAPSETGADLAPYLDGGQMAFHVLARGALPDSPWTAVLRACFLLNVKVDYGKSL